MFGDVQDAEGVSNGFCGSGVGVPLNAVRTLRIPSQCSRNAEGKDIGETDSDASMAP